MKSIRLPLMNKKFDDQYTFELHGYLTLQDFQSTITTINNSVAHQPPPGNKIVWLGILWTVWILIALATYTVWISLDFVYVLFAIPILMLIATAVFLWRHRHIRYKFEQSVLDTCSTINATENIRGINYRFSKNGADITSNNYESNNSVLAFCSKPLYAIVIEFDDRYNAFVGQKYSVRYHAEDFVSIPLYAGVDEPESALFSEKNLLQKGTASDLPSGILYSNEKDPNVIRYT
ncbi:hypothetical protein BDB00DRAFT_861559 [Zychaea mexicana]|uniref:uncharacterized protein n=1 Tax=Zychaea mexicana TaxID=64656 RepID=UPI0022FE31A4|nr:uncharacterized protein BDB00DRAFT_861559 [Zychaea mexicana]KAI9472873.1 hypothetical protein BDB00DRAFT_861559 [Zychaea mexicana]